MRTPRPFRLQKSQPETNSQAPQRARTDAAIEALRHQEEQPTLPEIHLHIDPPEKSSVPGWVKIAVALGVPAVILELFRRFLP